MNKKGQALIEFILILPILLIVVFAVVDFGRIINAKTTIENNTADAVLLYQNGKSVDEVKAAINKIDKDIDVLFTTKDDYMMIKLSKSIKPITPGMNKIPTKVFDVSASRVIKNE